MLYVKLPSPPRVDINNSIAKHNIDNNIFLSGYIASITYTIGCVSEDEFICKNPAINDDGIFALVDTKSLPNLTVIIDYYSDELRAADNLLSRIEEAHQAGRLHCPMATLEDLLADVGHWPSGWIGIYIEFIICICRSMPPTIKTIEHVYEELLSEVAFYNKEVVLYNSGFDENAARHLAAQGVPFEQVFKIIDHAKDLTQNLHRQHRSISDEQYQKESREICVGAFDEIMILIGCLMNDIRSDPDYFKDKK